MCHFLPHRSAKHLQMKEHCADLSLNILAVAILRYGQLNFQLVIPLTNAADYSRRHQSLSPSYWCALVDVFQFLLRF